MYKHQPYKQLYKGWLMALLFFCGVQNSAAQLIDTTITVAPEIPEIEEVEVEEKNSSI